MGSFTGRPGPAGWIPWAVWTEYVANDLILTHKGPYTEPEKASLLGWATTGALLFAVPQIVSKIGLGTIGWVAAIYYAGKWTSQAIDPDQGKENYYGFISGGIWGNEPNYGSAQRPGSGGYFDIPGHIARILLSRDPKKETPTITTVTQDQGWQNEMTKEMEIELGYITVDEYLAWFNSELKKMEISKAKRDRWNALSKKEQEGLIATRIEVQRNSRFW